MRSIKEKQLLVKWAKAMNEPIDSALVEEVERYERLQSDVVESIKQNILEDLKQASTLIPEDTSTPSYPLPPSLDEVLELFKEEVKQPEIVKEKKAETLPERVAEHISKEVKLEERSDSYQQPNIDLPARSLGDIRKKIKFLEDWVAKISITGPGGGAGDVINLDHPVKLVTSNYTITRNDYYIGINATSSINITLPSAIGYPGRMVIIKDESGNCSNNPIVVNGTVDNDPGGFILQQDNGGIQMIYREGWRIV